MLLLLRVAAAAAATAGGPQVLAAVHRHQRGHAHRDGGDERPRGEPARVPPARPHLLRGGHRRRQVYAGQPARHGAAHSHRAHSHHVAVQSVLPARAGECVESCGGREGGRERGNVESVGVGELRYGCSLPPPPPPHAALPHSPPRPSRVAPPCRTSASWRRHASAPSTPADISW